MILTLTAPATAAEKVALTIDASNIGARIPGIILE
jgi:hypothetical protein